MARDFTGNEVVYRQTRSYSRIKGLPPLDIPGRRQPEADLKPFLLGRLAPVIEIFSQILQTDAFGGFLTVFYSHERQDDTTRAAIANNLVRCQVREEVTADLFERDYGLAGILCHM